MPQEHVSRMIRYLALGAIIGAGIFWAGAQWGPRDPQKVGAVPASAPQRSAPAGSRAGAATAALTPDEELNVRVYQQAAPAVANIVTQAVQYDWFQNPFSVEGAGSGFLIDDRGYILTNFHVVAGARSIEVTLGSIRDRNTYAANFVGGDQRLDVALLKIDSKGRKLTPLPLSDSNAVQVGQRVLAIGNPFGFQSTLTTGIVSAIGRTVQTGETRTGPTFIDRAIQTDAAINRGNSGGPLLNSAGQVIGMNTAIYSPSGATAGIGFAIPINTAKQIADDLIKEGRVRRAYLGIEGTPLWPELADALDLPVNEGMLIERVAPGSSADRAGIRGGTRAVLAGMRRLYIGGDALVAIDGERVGSDLDLSLLMSRKRPGDTVTATIYRGAKKIDVKVTLSELPAR